MDDWKTLDVNGLFSFGLMNRPNVVSNKNNNGFDPYRLMVKRKQNMNSESSDVNNIVVQQYDDNDVRELEEFCYKHNIVGFNFGKMHPKSALQMLKNKLGVLNDDINNKKILKG